MRKQLRERGCDSRRWLGHPKLAGRVRAHVLALMASSPHEDWTFSGILKSSLNADPVLVDRALRKLTQEGTAKALGYNNYRVTSQGIATITDADFNATVSSLPRLDMPELRLAEEGKETIREILDGLPEPSPVYSQWWFSQQSCERLVTLLQESMSPQGDAAFVACPTLGTAFSRLVAKRTSVFDVDSELLRVLSQFASPRASFHNIDVLRGLAEPYFSRYSLVFIDPPWSRNALPHFLTTGALLLAKGGLMMISFPQEFTRPGIYQERKHLLALAAGCGLAKQGMSPGYTQYAIPEFERCAYSNLLPSSTASWRSGDLFVFRKVGDTIPSVSYQDRVIPSQETNWEQFVFGRLRVFLRRDGVDEDGPPRIDPIGDLQDFRCPTTSSRATLWSAASFVSTRNTIARVQGRAELSRVLRRLSAMQSPLQTRSIGDRESEGNRLVARLMEFLQP